MGKGTSESTQQTQQSSQTNPWAPTQGILQNILAGIGGQTGNYQPTAAETGALNTLQSNAQNTPNYTPQATSLANSLMSGGGTDANAGILGSAYQNYQNQMNPTANQNNDPTQTPGMAQLLATIRGDVGNSVNGMFAGAGRDMSGMNTQTLARGISQGEAAPLLAQYNQNVQNQTGAAGNLFNAGGTTAQGMQGLQQQGYANQAQGLDMGVNGIPAAQNAGATNILSAANTARGLPLQNLGMLEGLTIPIAGLGGQTTGTSSTQGTQTMSPFQMAMMGLNQFAGGGIGGSGGGSNLLKMLSDRRTKDDIEQIGALFDGTPVYRFRYKGNPRVTVGLMADDVEQYAPEAVAEVHGLKMVDYGAATERAVQMGAR